MTNEGPLDERTNKRKVNGRPLLEPRIDEFHRMLYERKINEPATGKF